MNSSVNKNSKKATNKSNKATSKNYAKSKNDCLFKKSTENKLEHASPNNNCNVVGSNDDQATLLNKAAQQHQQQSSTETAKQSTSPGAKSRVKKSSKSDNIDEMCPTTSLAYKQTPNHNARSKQNLSGKEPSVTFTEKSNGQSLKQCVTLDEYVSVAREMRNGIEDALKSQATSQQLDPPIEVTKLCDGIKELSKFMEPEDYNQNDSQSENASQEEDKLSSNATTENHHTDKESSNASDKPHTNEVIEFARAVPICDDSTTQSTPRGIEPVESITNNSCQNKSLRANAHFEPLEAKLDSGTKFAALTFSLQKHFSGAPQLLEQFCRKLVDINAEREKFEREYRRYQDENHLLNAKCIKLESLCRELQKSNNSIRIESLDLIKAEQSRAKEQTAKIQLTLSSVIKLFDENQQRNMGLRQENIDLQSRLKALLEHCGSWEKSVEISLKQKDIENRLVKTELVKSNLSKNEMKEDFLREKQELLRVLAIMREQQQKIEGQEAKLRSDLSDYASKYDQCKEAIAEGMDKFQVESKRMVKQLEKSKQDYGALFSKYESCNKQLTKLLEEKKSWTRSIKASEKKVETLEKLCRALRSGNKIDAKMDDPAQEVTLNANINESASVS